MHLKWAQSLLHFATDLRWKSMEYRINIYVPAALENDTQAAMQKGSGIADSEFFLKSWSKYVRSIKGSLFYLRY